LLMLWRGVSMTSTFPLSKVRIMLLMACICLLASSPMALGQANDQPPSLFLFPRFIASQGVDSGLAIFNPSPIDASVTLLLVSEDGGLVDGATLMVPALGQTAKTARQLFSDTTLGSALFVASNTPGLIAYYQTFDPAMTFIDGADAPEEAMELV